MEVMKLFAFTRKGLCISAALTMLLSASCDFFPIKIQDALGKGSNMVLAGRIRGGKQVTAGGNETAAAAERTRAPAVRNTPVPDGGRARRANLSSGQVRLPVSAGAVTGTALLRRGNNWSKGLPGFGENVFPGFFGEYHLKLKPGPANGEAENLEKAFFVWASKEPLFFPEENWEMLPPIRPAGETVLFPEDDRAEPSAAGYPVVRRLNDEHDILALMLHENTHDEIWRVFFQFFQDNDSPHLSAAQTNRLIGEWVKWFLYFRASAQNPVELSFPAVLHF
ncbi:MAG: hypothetical protein LBP76_06560 [Treponema sp.]|jgi:hypothetical protein|nr:hypothetical protein [Treponema sp.]